MKRLLFIGLILFCISCKKDKKDYETYQVDIVAVEGPDIALSGSQIEFTLHWPFSSGCDVFDRISDTKKANLITVKAIGHTEDGPCTLHTGIAQKPYFFTASQPGTYEFQFYSSDGSYISHLVTFSR